MSTNTSANTAAKTAELMDFRENHTEMLQVVAQFSNDSIDSSSSSGQYTSRQYTNSSSEQPELTTIFSNMLPMYCPDNHVEDDIYFVI